MACVCPHVELRAMRVADDAFGSKDCLGGGPSIALAFTDSHIEQSAHRGTLLLSLGCVACHKDKGNRYDVEEKCP